jgi:hypothetical protein
MMSEKRLEEMKDMVAYAQATSTGERPMFKALALALNDAVHEIEELRRKLEAQRNATAAMLPLIDRH